MATSISILPLDVLDVLSQQLNNGEGSSSGSNSGLSFLRLPHPRTNIPSLFLPCRKKGQNVDTETILEVQAIAPYAERSWFLDESEVISDGKLLLMTPIDPAFLLIPILETTLQADGSLSNFRAVDDIFDTAIAKLSDVTLAADTKEDASSTSICAADITRFLDMRCTQEGMRRVCEYKQVTEDIIVYRYTRQKATEYMTKKIRRLTKAGTVDASRILVRELAKDGLMEDGKEALLEAGRLKLACDMVSQYLPPPLYQELLSKFEFTALKDHVQAMHDSSLSTAIQSSSSSSKNNDENTDADNKKRKAAAHASKGVEKLKKANIKGMSKLSSFFGKPKEDAKAKA